MSLQRFGVFELVEIQAAKQVAARWIHHFDFLVLLKALKTSG